MTEGERIAWVRAELERTARDCDEIDARGDEVDGAWVAGMIRGAIAKLPAPPPSSDTEAGR